MTKSKTSEGDISTTSGSSKDETSKTIKRNFSRTSVSRLVFLTSMAAAAAACGYIAYRSIDNLEDKVSEETYESIAISALQGAQAIALRKVEGSDAMAAVLAATFPNASDWPFVAMPEYINVASKVARLSSSTSTALITVIKPEDAQRFEEFASSVYRDHHYPETAGVSSFGFGIFGFDRANETLSDGRYHDTTGANNWNNTLDIMTPIFQHNIVNAKSLLYNVHSNVVRGTAIESSIKCAEASSEPFPQCGVITDVVILVVRPGPAGLLYQPIYPTNDPNTVVGFVGTSINWEEVLTNVVPDYVDGLDCVIQTSTETYTYVILNGEPVLRGSGDLHDPDFNEFGRSIVLNDIETGASASAVYTLTIYPTPLMFEQFHTNSPLAVSLGFVAVILFCVGCFFLYDFFIQGESRQRQLILDMKRRFVRFISHEIRTPLNTVCMGLALLQSELQTEMGADEPDGTNQNENGKDNIKEKASPRLAALAAYWMDLTGDIMENTENAVSVLNDLLNYDKIESGNFVLTVGEVNIWSLVEKTVSEFQLPAKNREVVLQCTILETDMRPELRVFGDDIRLCQVIRNLVSNSLKFTPTGGNVTVEVSYLPDGLQGNHGISKASGGKRSRDKSPIDEAPCPHPRSGAVSIAVRDDGAGMTEDQLRQVFTEYTQFDSNKLQSGGGSGLGLNITKAIVEQHGGTIRAESQGRDMGCTFTAELPLYKYPVRITEKKRNDEERTSESTSQETHHLPRNHHILVVDDVLTNTKMMVRLLERAGHTCAVADNGKEAIDAYVVNQKAASSEDPEDHCAPLFDTILMDSEMPVMDGPEATKKLRAMGCHAFIFGVTGNVLAEDVAHFRECGADDVIPKPVKLSMLDDCWSRAI